MVSSAVAVMLNFGLFPAARGPFMPGKFRTFLLLTLMLVVYTTIRLRYIAAQQDSPTVASSSNSHQLLQYTLPPDKLQKAYALYLLTGTLYFVTTAWTFLILYLMLRARFGVWLRDWAERASRFRVLQAVIVMSLLVLVLELTLLPFDSYQHHISLKYGLSVQHWGSWFWDWAKSLLLGFLIASVVGWGLYAALRRSPRRW